MVVRRAGKRIRSAMVYGLGHNITQARSKFRAKHKTARRLEYLKNSNSLVVVYAEELIDLPPFISVSNSILKIPKKIIS